jgi:hypothetical protein
MQALRSFAVATAALLLASAPFSSPLSAQTLPSAAEVLTKYVAAIGGKDAIMKITSLKQTSTMQVPAVGMTAEVESYQAAPNKMATRSTLPGVGEMVQGTNGEIAWDANPMQGPRLLGDKELTQTLEGADFYGNLLYPAERFSTLENLGIVDFNGEKAYKVKLVRKASGNESTQYFSVATGLIVGAELTQQSQMGSMQVSSTLSEYKEFGGVKFPTKTEVTMGANKLLMTVTNVVINGAPATAFDVPEAVKPLIKK